MDQEKIPTFPGYKESALTKKRRELEEQGYTFAGDESLTTFKFSKESALFKVVPLKTKEDVIQEYTDRFKDKTNIDIILVERDDLEQGQKSVLVFIKPKK